MDDIIKLVKAYLNNETTKFDDDSIVSKAKAQALLPMLYLATKNNNYKKYYLSSLITQENFKKIENEVTAILNENKIPHIYFKGKVLSNIYPDPVVRTRGDIDVYIEENTITKVTSLLEDNGYKKDPSDCMHHIGFYKNNLEIEIHFSMFDSESNFLKYFKNPFSLAINKDKFMYEFNPNDHFIYCLCHFYNHLINGCGIRFVLDFYYMIKNYELDFNYIHNFIKEYKLEILYNNILNVIYYLTNEKYDNVEIIDIEFFIDYLVKSGIHGFDSDERDTNRAINKKDKFRYTLMRLFMTNKQYRISLYPKMGRYWFLYPICFIHHLFYLLIFKSKKAFKLLFTGNKISKEKKDYYKKLGL